VDAGYTVAALDDERATLVRDGRVRVGGDPIPVRVTKDIAVGGDRATPTLEETVTLENRSSFAIDALVAVEWATTMLGGGGNPAAFYEVDGVRSPHDGSGSAVGVSLVRSGNTYIGVEVATRAEPPASAWWGAIDTISNSEGGFERVYQGSCLVFSWPLHLAPGASRTFRVRHEVSTTRDRAEEEGL